MRGGDLIVHPISTEQQQTLLNLTSIANRSVLCYLPISNSNIKGVIFGVPIQDSADEIKMALADQDVSDAKRHPMKGRPEIQSETVLLTFTKKLPDSVKMASMMYRVHPSHPNPFRYKKCFRLEHIASRCSAQQSCRICAKPHPPDTPCSTRCVNCSSPSHTSAATPALHSLR
jgi:hypothetical protein